MFQDEARFGRISDTRYCWCRRPHRPMVKAMVTQQYTYAYGAVSPLDGRFDSLMLPHVNSGCMQVFLDEVAQRYPNDNIVMVLDGRSIKLSLRVSTGPFKPPLFIIFTSSASKSSGNATALFAAP